MNRFLKKHADALKTTALMLMLAIPFLLYAAALHGSILQVKLLMAIFIAIMLFVMKNG